MGPARENRDAAAPTIDAACVHPARVSDALREGSEAIEGPSVARLIASEEIGIVSVHRDTASVEIDRARVAR
jgi:hypothetical protein